MLLDMYLQTSPSKRLRGQSRDDKRTRNPITQFGEEDALTFTFTNEGVHAKVSSVSKKKGEGRKRRDRK